ncbi:hypothetical protein [Saccharopolyspora shandongensis]|uniref:hypothetical protein n=1 Tax=Saccharopolyspora shandongensis TaxID=418495 RepID=UPI0015A702DC|nr:hypothetical protein [Saccharopolyspora shandongensis]
MSEKQSGHYQPSSSSPREAAENGLPFHRVLGDLRCEAGCGAQAGDLVVQSRADRAGQEHEGKARQLRKLHG